MLPLCSTQLGPTKPKVFKVVRGQHGISFVEVLVVAALLGLVFSGLFSGLQLMVNIISNSKAEAGARSLATERLEYIRSLPYDQVGTVAGIPAGSIPQNSTTTLNGISYSERVFIAYLDRPEDGFGAVDNTLPGVPADANGIEADSKVVKIEYSWSDRGQTRTTTFVSDIVPNGIESTAGGGTLLINVFDASVQPVVGAEVRIINNSIPTTTDIVVTTNVNGMANFPGAPAGAGYEVVVTKPGYSTDQTYSASATNTSPNPPHVAVVAGNTSTVNFAIDRLSDLTLRTISTPVTALFSDGFSTPAQIASSSDAQVSGGAVILSGSSGSYANVGIAYSTPIVPSLISSWESIDFNGTTTPRSEFRVRLYEVVGSGSTTMYNLIPDAELAANSIGFVQGPIDITSIDPATYDRVAMGVTLTSTSSLETPELFDWSITHIESEAPISGITFDLISNKTIGDNGGVPVYKYTNTVTTNASGEVDLTNLEWDAYDITLDGSVTGYNIKESYAPIPYALDPNQSDTLTLVMEPHSPYSLRTTVVDTLGSPVGGAAVQLTRTGYDVTQETSIYGQTFFTGIASNTDYTVSVAKDGYDEEIQTNVSITGTTDMTFVLATAGSSGGSGTTTPPTPPPTASSTFLAGYDTRVPISIDGSGLFGAVNDFPVYVDLHDLPASFFQDVQAGGGDIRVTTADGQTEVPREVVAIDTTTQSGELHFRAPSLQISTTSVFYLYYGSSTALTYAHTDPFGGDNVWTNGYQAVYHFEEVMPGTGGGGVYFDSTGNGFDGDDFVSATGKDGILGRGQEFNDAFDDYIRLPHTTIDGLRDITVSTWFKSSNTSNLQTILSAANTAWTDNEHTIWIRGDQNQVELFSHDTAGREEFNVGNVFDDVWRHFVIMKDDTTNQASLYLNGVENSDSPDADTVWTIEVDPGGLIIGQEQDFVGGGFDNGQELDGEIDEMRISNVVRDAGWIRNEYQNQNNSTGFYSVGSRQTE